MILVQETGDSMICPLHHPSPNLPAAEDSGLNFNSAEWGKDFEDISA